MASRALGTRAPGWLAKFAACIFFPATFVRPPCSNQQTLKSRTTSGIPAVTAAGLRRNVPFVIEIVIARRDDMR
jgi:hypothetical protein